MCVCVCVCVCVCGLFFLCFRLYCLYVVDSAVFAFLNVLVLCVLFWIFVFSIVLFCVFDCADFIL